jgi:carboxyl-terminal processing protease
MRGEYTIPSVNQRIDPDEGRLGILTISLIGSHTAEEVTQAIENLQAEGATHFVLDLRSNPGGYLNAGVDLSRLFLAQGDILMERDRQRKVKSHHVEQPGPFTDFPLAVLIGQNTASSAEVLAGALQVNQRAILVGTNSFGKDTIQHVFVLKDGSSLSMTAAHWWVPGLEDSFAGQGLVPDLPAPEFDDPNQTDPALAAVKAYFFP